VPGILKPSVLTRTTISCTQALPRAVPVPLVQFLCHTSPDCLAIRDLQPDRFYVSPVKLLPWPKR
jgi:hypothetical protein